MKEKYCGKYKGISIFEKGQMIGHNWYGTLFVKENKGAAKRKYKVKESEKDNFKDLKAWIDNALNNKGNSMVFS